MFTRTSLWTATVPARATDKTFGAALTRLGAASLALAGLAFGSGAMAGGNTVTYGPVFVPPGIPGGVAVTPRPAPGNAVPSPGEDIGQWAGTWMANASAFCAALADPAYQIDCLSERIEYIAWQLEGDQSYAAVRAELLRAARDLHSVSSRYRDSGKPAQSYATPATGRVGPQRSTRPITPVRSADQAAAVAEARAIVARTETVLLRSSDNRLGVSPQITRIAAAVGSNKVLLRST